MRQIAPVTVSGWVVFEVAKCDLKRPLVETPEHRFRLEVCNFDKKFLARDERTAYKCMPNQITASVDTATTGVSTLSQKLPEARRAD